MSLFSTKEYNFASVIISRNTFSTMISFPKSKSRNLAKKEAEKALASSEKKPSNTGSYFAGKGRTYLKQEERRRNQTRFN